ncbi:MAG: helix-turn-helix domain-containing protein [Hyphomonas sp.]
MTSVTSKRSSAPTTVDKDVSERIRSIRLQKGMSQADVAAGLGIVHQQYHKYESGLNRFSAGMMVKIAESLDCMVADLFPPTLRGSKTLESEQRVDVLKQELVKLVLDTTSEAQLIALRTILLDLANSSKRAAA